MRAGGGLVLRTLKVFSCGRERGERLFQVGFESDQVVLSCPYGFSGRTEDLLPIRQISFEPLANLVGKPLAGVV